MWETRTAGAVPADQLGHAAADRLATVRSATHRPRQAATVVRDRTAELTARSVTLDAEFPLDDGEHAAVTLANDVDAAFVLRDERNSPGLIHASLVDTRPVTTPTLLSVFVRTGKSPPDDARGLLTAISTARRWDANTYVESPVTACCVALTGLAIASGTRHSSCRGRASARIETGRGSRYGPTASDERAVRCPGQRNGQTV